MQTSVPPDKLPKPILVRKLKLDGVVHLNQAYEFGTDEHGTWLFTPAGSLHRGEAHGDIGWCQSAQDASGAGQHAIKLICAETRWSACSWIQTASGVITAADIARPPERTTEGWTYVDLELDPYRDAAGQVRVDDWDEFDEAVASGHISETEAECARQECMRIVHALRTNEEPYGVVASQALANAIATGWPPLSDRHAITWPL